MTLYYQGGGSASNIASMSRGSESYADDERRFVTREREMELRSVDRLPQDLSHQGYDIDQQGWRAPRGRF